MGNHVRLMNVIPERIIFVSRGITVYESTRIAKCMINVHSVSQNIKRATASDGWADASMNYCTTASNWGTYTATHKRCCSNSSVYKQNCDTQTNKWEASAVSGLYVYQQTKGISQICRSWGLDSSVLTWFHASSSVSRYSSQTIKPSRTGWHPPQWKSNPIIAGAQSIPNLRATRFKPGTATKYKYLQKHMVTTWIMHPQGNNSGMLTYFVKLSLKTIHLEKWVYWTQTVCFVFLCNLCSKYFVSYASDKCRHISKPSCWSVLPTLLL